MLLFVAYTTTLQVHFINPPFCWKHHAVFQYQILYVLCWWHSSPEGKVLHHCPWVKQWNFSYIASIFSHRDSVNLKKWMCLYIGSVARVYALYLWFHLWSRLEGRWKWGARSLMANNSLMVSTPDTETPFFFFFSLRDVWVDSRGVRCSW